MVRNYGRTRAGEDLAEGCVERFNFGYFLWVYLHPGRAREIRITLSLREGRRIVVLRSRKAVARFLESVSAEVEAAT